MIDVATAIACAVLILLPPPLPADGAKAPPAERARRATPAVPPAAPAASGATATSVDRTAAPAPQQASAAGWVTATGQAATGALENLDRSGHDLELSCGEQQFSARIEGRERTLLAAPVQAGCLLKVLGTGRTLTLGDGPLFELVIENGVPRSTARPLTWAVKLRRYGNIAIWPVGLSRQWASAATASSEYSAAGWSAQQATGAPSLAACADSAQAWTTRSSSSAQPEWIELRYPARVRAVGARLFVTLTPGAVRTIEGKTAAGWETLWQGSDPTASCPAVLELQFNEEIDTDTIRVVLDTSKQSYWFELDAVELLGKALQ